MCSVPKDNVKDIISFWLLRNHISLEIHSNNWLQPTGWFSRSELQEGRYKDMGRWAVLGNSVREETPNEHQAGRVYDWVGLGAGSTSEVRGNFKESLEYLQNSSPSQFQSVEFICCLKYKRTALLQLHECHESGGNTNCGCSVVISMFFSLVSHFPLLEHCSSLIII